MTEPRGAKADDRREVRIFIHLARGFDARIWEKSWREGTLIGFNSRSPYGYHLAEHHGFEVQFSQDRPEGLISKSLRLAVRAVLGFDLLHAWRNRHDALKADVIWTHTESQFLAFALVLRLARHSTPKLLGQCVWMFDRWKSFSLVHRAFYRWLIARVDVLTTLSPLNLEQARALFPDTRSEIVLFGIPTDQRWSPRDAAASGPIRVVALGNDEHRDWDMFIKAVGGVKGIKVEIASSTIDRATADAFENITIRKIRKNGDLYALYREADLVVVPLKPNIHASGITVMQEAALSRVAMIATDVGGLRAYFSDNQVCYVPPGDPAGLANAIGRLAGAPHLRRSLAEEAQARMGVSGTGESGLGSSGPGGSGLGVEAYVSRHVELSLDLLGYASKGNRIPGPSTGARVR